jgi:hypothetical protein
MSQQVEQSGYTEAELEANSIADALAMLAIVTVLVALTVFFVAG